MDNSELSLSPVTAKGETHFEESKGSGKVAGGKKTRPTIELNKNDDVTNSSVETEKASYAPKPG